MMLYQGAEVVLISDNTNLEIAGRCMHAGAACFCVLGTSRKTRVSPGRNPSYRDVLSRRCANERFDSLGFGGGVGGISKAVGVSRYFSRVRSTELSNHEKKNCMRPRKEVSASCRPLYDSCSAHLLRLLASAVSLLLHGHGDAWCRLREGRITSGLQSIDFFRSRVGLWSWAIRRSCTLPTLVN